MTRSEPDISGLPALPRDAQGPVFAEPWQAQVFALAVKLSEDGVFTWREWAEALAAELAAAGPDDPAERYYEHWLAALEKLVDGKGLTSRGERRARHEAWERAFAATPHGEPVLLSGTEPTSR